MCPGGDVHILSEFQMSNSWPKINQSECKTVMHVLEITVNVVIDAFIKSKRKICS